MALGVSLQKIDSCVSNSPAWLNHTLGSGDTASPADRDGNQMSLTTSGALSFHCQGLELGSWQPGSLGVGGGERGGG